MLVSTHWNLSQRNSTVCVADRAATVLGIFLAAFSWIRVPFVVRDTSTSLRMRAENTLVDCGNVPHKPIMGAAFRAIATSEILLRGFVISVWFVTK